MGVAPIWLRCTGRPSHGTSRSTRHAPGRRDRHELTRLAATEDAYAAIVPCSSEQVHVSLPALYSVVTCAHGPASRVSSIVRASPVGTRRAGGERRHAVLGTRALLHVDKRKSERSSLGAALLGEEHCLRGRVPRVRGGPAPFWSRREAPGWASSARPPRCLREQESVKE